MKKYSHKDLKEIEICEFLICENNIIIIIIIIIAHASEVLRYFGGSTEATTEESQEKMNKEFRGARQYHERKNSRLNNFIDIARWLLQKSDPVLY